MKFTTRRMAVALVCMFLCWVILQPARSAPPTGGSPKWEYKIDINSGMANVVLLNQAGADGWELVTVAVENSGNTTAIYKRVKSDLAKK